MFLAPPCQPPTLLVAPLNHLFPSDVLLSSSYSNSNYCNRTPTRVSSNHIPHAFPRLSLSTPTIHNKNKEFVLLFRKQLKLLCSSALLVPSLQTQSTKINSESRFLSLALAKSYDDDEPYIEEEEEEDKATASAVLQKEEEVPAGLNLVSGVGLWAQLMSSHVALGTGFYTRALTNFMSSPAEIWIFDALQLCTFISAVVAVERYAFLAQERQKSVNDPSNSSPPVKGASSPIPQFYQGVLWSFLGTCLAIMVFQSSVYMLKRYQELGYNYKTGLIQSIFKNLTPGSLVMSSELLALRASTFHILANLFGLVCSLQCYNRRESIQPQAVTKHLGLVGLALLIYSVKRILVAWLPALFRI